MLRQWSKVPRITDNTPAPTIRSANSRTPMQLIFSSGNFKFELKELVNTEPEGDEGGCRPDPRHHGAVIGHASVALKPDRIGFHSISGNVYRATSRHVIFPALRVAGGDLSIKLACYKRGAMVQAPIIDVGNCSVNVEDCKVLACYRYARTFARKHLIQVGCLNVVPPLSMTSVFFVLSVAPQLYSQIRRTMGAARLHE